MPPSVPSTGRDAYVIGKLGSYLLPSLGTCERLITQMTQLLRSPECRDDPKLKDRVEWDRDLCLDRWGQLSFEFHAQAAMNASRSNKTPDLRKLVE